MPPLLDRDAEIGRLLDLLGAARRGEGRVAVISGAAGIGKTALLDELCAKADDEKLTVLRARGGEFEQELPLGVVRQLFVNAVASLDDESRARVVAGAASRAVKALDSEGPPIPEAELFHSLHWLCANLAAECAVVLAVDDAHFADTISLQWLRYLASRVEQLPVLIVMTTDAT